jgi:hypothetical protein
MSQRTSPARSRAGSAASLEPARRPRESRVGLGRIFAQDARGARRLAVPAHWPLILPVVWPRMVAKP